MQNGRLYMNYNFAQRKSASKVLDEFFHQLQWAEGGKLLDIGSGSGDVLTNLIVPKLPEYVEVHGSDLSPQMVKFAKQNFRGQQVSFYQADISANFELLANKLPHPYDNITSFFCFHWVQDQGRAIENIYKLLKPNGSVLMDFLGYSPVYDIYEELSKNKTYEIYMKDIQKTISPYHHLENPLKVFREHIHSAGFKEKHLEIRDQVYIYENTDQLKNAVLSTNPFTARMPADLIDQFIADYFVLVERFTENKLIGVSSEIVYRYKLIVALLTK